MKHPFRILQTGILIAGLAAAQTDASRTPSTTPGTPSTQGSPSGGTYSPGTAPTDAKGMDGATSGNGSYPGNSSTRDTSERQNNFGWLGLLGLVGLTGLFRRDPNRVTRDDRT